MIYSARNGITEKYPIAETGGVSFLLVEMLISKELMASSAIFGDEINSNSIYGGCNCKHRLKVDSRFNILLCKNVY